MIEYIGQGIGLIAMAFNILSYQCKTAKGVIAMHIFGAGLFAVSFLMLGSYTGGMLNIIAAIQSLLFYYKEKTKADRPLWIGIFALVFIGTYFVTLFLLMDAPRPIDYLIEVLPVIGMMFVTLAFRKDEASKVRLLGLGSSSTWLVYNICQFAIGAIVCEVLSLGSIFIGMLRLDRKKKND